MRRRDLTMATLAGLVVTMFAFTVLGGLQAGLLGAGRLLAGALLVGLFLLVTAVVYGKRAGGESGSRSIWDAIPSWQYTGRHVESGGITVDGQERAIEDVREQAEAEEDRLR